MNSKKDPLIKKVSKNSLYTGIFNIWYLGTRLALVPFILSNISVEEYGLWTYCWIILSYIGLAAVGFNTTYIRYAADYRSRNEDHKLNELLSTGLLTMTLFSLVLFPILYFLASEILGFLGVGADLHQTARNLFLGAAVIFMLNFSFSGYQYILEGEQRIDLVRKIQLFASLVEIILLILFFVNGLGVVSLVWAYGIRYLIILCLSIFFAYRTFPLLRVSVAAYRREALNKFLNFGGKLQLIGFLSILNQSVDRILIAKFLQLEAVGFYEVARKLPNIGMTLPSAIAGSMMPAAAHLHGTEQQDRIKNAIIYGTRYLMILVSVPYAVLIYFAPLIIDVWLGESFVNIAPVVQLLALGTFINLFSGMSTSCLRGMGNTNLETRYMVLSLLILTIAAPLLINLFGLVGAAGAFCISQAVGTIYFLVRSNREFGITCFAFYTLFPVALIFITGLPLFAAFQFLIDFSQMSRWWGLTVLIGLIFSYIALLTFGLIFFKDRLLLDAEKRKWADWKLLSMKERLFSKQWKPA